MRVTFRVEERRRGRVKVWFGRIVKGAGVLLLALAFQGSGEQSCVPVEPTEPAPVECWTDADCPPDQLCEGAVDCPPGAFCILPASPGTCVDPPPPPDECWTDADCPDGLVCDLTPGECPPGMYCILPAGPGACVEPPPPPGECWSDADCPPGTACVGAVECPPDAICILPASPGTCEPTDVSQSDGAAWRALAERALRG